VQTQEDASGSIEVDAVAYDEVWKVVAMGANAYAYQFLTSALTLS